MIEDIDYLVVGQGVAGACLALHLYNEGQNVVVVNEEDESVSSYIAAGMFNPFTGRKNVVKTWLADDLFPYLKKFYQEVESITNDKFLNIIPIYRPFNDYEGKSSFIDKFKDDEWVNFNTQALDKSFKDKVNIDFGATEINMSGYLNIPIFLKATTQLFKSSNRYLNATFDYDELLVYPEYFVWKNYRIKRVIFAEGLKAKQNPWFHWLPFVPSKGDVFKLQIKDFPESNCINKEVMMIPLGENQFRVGSTYVWKYSHIHPTDEGYRLLNDKVKKMITIPYSVVEHKSGVRPSIHDQRPVIGEHPKQKNIFVFNGMGTKGVSLSPWFAKVFVENLLYKKEMPTEIKIDRFISLYSKNLI